MTLVTIPRDVLVTLWNCAMAGDDLDAYDAAMAVKPMVDEHITINRYNSTAS